MVNPSALNRTTLHAAAAWRTATWGTAWCTAAWGACWTERGSFEMGVRRWGWGVQVGAVRGHRKCAEQYCGDDCNEANPGPFQQHDDRRFIHDSLLCRAILPALKWKISDQSRLFDDYIEADCVSGARLAASIGSNRLHGTTKLRRLAFLKSQESALGSIA